MGGDKKYVISLLSAEYAQRVVKVKKSRFNANASLIKNQISVFLFCFVVCIVYTNFLPITASLLCLKPV